MTTTTQLLKEGRKEEVWKRHLGFFDLSREAFMQIQERLLTEQLRLLATSRLGKHLLGDPPPLTLAEFRQRVPYTTYKDYATFLMEKDEDALPVKPYMWARTSGRSSAKGLFKWVPYTEQMYNLLGEYAVSGMIACSASHKGDVKVSIGDRMLLATAPLPYVSGMVARATRDQLSVRFLPDIEKGELMSFGERVSTGFRLAMREGLDYFYGLASVLARMGEQFESTGGGTKPSLSMLNPLTLWRLSRAVITARVENRPLLPRDIWQLKGIATGGTDAAIYRDKIMRYWGKQPLEGYASTEGSMMAMQAWNFKGMVFFPDSNFYEFIPQDELAKQVQDSSYVPRSVLYSELRSGIYEVVFTNFHGGVFVRYRIGDYVRVVAQGDDEIGNDLPQVEFYSRVSDIIDIGALARFTERDIWGAIENSGVPYVDWVARKEFRNSEPFLHLYIEPKPGTEVNAEDARYSIHQQLHNEMEEYRDLIDMLGRQVLDVSILPQGAFDNYMQAQLEAGADLAHVKPPHMQPRDEIMQRLMQTQD